MLCACVMLLFMNVKQPSSANCRINSPCLCPCFYSVTVLLLVSGSSWFSSYCDKIKEDEMGVACGTHGGEQKCVLEKVLWGNLKERDH
jgi:hypothetical protein